MFALGDLIRSKQPGYRYGYIGTRDRMMYPLIMPGAIVEIDEARKRIVSGPWRRKSKGPSTFWKRVPDMRAAGAPLKTVA